MLRRQLHGCQPSPPSPSTSPPFSAYKSPTAPAVSTALPSTRFTHLAAAAILVLCALAMAPTAIVASPANASMPSARLVTLLLRLQNEALHTLGHTADFDPKLYVDLPLKTDLASAEAAFAALPRCPNVPAADLAGFVEEFFGAAGSDLIYHEPKGFVQEPEDFLPNVKNEEVRRWALQVHGLWKILSRRVSDDVKMFPERHTLLPLPWPVVVPGARFREVYYWDTYWIIRGLLVSKMYTAAKELAYNLLFMVETYGFVFNGARAYYSNRSQPPLLSSIVLDIYKRTGDRGFVRKALPSLLKEHSHWVSDIHQVTIQDLQGHSHSLSHYYALWNKPRPEVATIDEENASKLNSSAEKENFYRQLASGAETGWDFSSRWMRNSSDLTTLATTSILPVDLNTFICKMEHDISKLALALGDSSTAEKFSKAFHAREDAIRAIFWNSQMEQWLDYWLDNSSYRDSHKWRPNFQNTNVFASNYAPVWLASCGSGPYAWSEESTHDSIVKSLKKSKLVNPAGIATSLKISGQQWDLPNGWAPLQHLIVEGLAKSGSSSARAVAEDLATRWIRSNYAAFKSTGAMHEKYDVQECGKFGGGGEYKPQTGFGWTNGVVLAFLEEFGWPEDKKIDCFD